MSEPANIDPVAEDEAGREIDPRYVAQQRLVGRLRVIGLSAATFAGLMVALLAADGLPAWGALALGLLWLGVVTLAAWHAEVWPARDFAHTRYRLDADGLRIARGVYWRSITHVPRSRVQHTDVSQGPLERRYGLGTLIVYTAGTDHAKVSLPGLAWDTALALRDELGLDRSDDDV